MRDLSLEVFKQSPGDRLSPAPTPGEMRHSMTPEGSGSCRVSYQVEEDTSCSRSSAFPLHDMGGPPWRMTQHQAWEHVRSRHQDEFRCTRFSGQMSVKNKEESTRDGETLVSTMQAQAGKERAPGSQETCSKRWGNGGLPSPWLPPAKDRAQRGSQPRRDRGLPTGGRGLFPPVALPSPLLPRLGLCCISQPLRREASLRPVWCLWPASWPWLSWLT